tara:strand:+ start:202 stop:1272 length:1071 start_codon:yes stop_codon:yes gene_type:complete
MAIKEKLIENQRLNNEIKFTISEEQSRLSYELGYSDSKVKPIDYATLFTPFIEEFASIQLKLQNGVSKNPVEDRKYSDKILGSVENIKIGLENLMGNTEVWPDMVQMAGLMGGLDLMGTPVGRFLCLSILNGDLGGTIEIVAIDGDIDKLAWEIYEKDGKFVERIFLNKLNELSEAQDMFVSIPNTNNSNESFKMASPEIFEQKKIGGGDGVALTGGVTEVYRKKKEDGKPKLNTKELGGNMVQDFYIVDKEIIGESLQFNTEMDKITLGLLEQYQSFDQVIAFNNNILAKVTDYYLKPATALKDNQQKKFQEDYKKWFLETQIGKEFPLGEPKPKEQPKKEVIEEEAVVEEQVVS